MTPDPLDALLDHSAPATTAARPDELGTMITRAAREARPARRRRRRVGVAAGALAVVLVGGASVAAATDGFGWAPWAQDPLGAVSFTMDSGFDCELRFSRFSGGSDAGFVDHANDVLEDWYQTADVVAGARAILPDVVADFGLADIDLQPGETVDTLPPGEAEHRRWSSEWLAWDLAVSELESEELARQGIDPADDRFAGSERNGQIQCFDENHELYVPGATP